MDYFYAQKHGILDEINSTVERALREIDVRQMFLATRPLFNNVLCKFGNYDCRNDWLPVGTIEGMCMKLDVNHVKRFSLHSKLKLTFMVLDEDYSVGWEKVTSFWQKLFSHFVLQSQGTTVYFTNMGQFGVMQQKHGIELDPLLRPGFN